MYKLNELLGACLSYRMLVSVLLAIFYWNVMKSMRHAGDILLQFDFPV